MELIKPDERYVSSYSKAIVEDVLHRPDARRLFDDPNTILTKFYRCEYDIDLAPGYVSATTLWLIDRGQFIGEICIRHELTPALLQFGGISDMKFAGPNAEKDTERKCSRWLYNIAGTC